MFEKQLKKYYDCNFDIDYGSNNQTLDIIGPKEDKKQLKPAVIYIHGGGWGSGSKNDYGGHMWNVEMCKYGFVSVSVDYTLKKEAIFPQQLIDLKEAIRFLKHHGKEYGIDVNKLAIWGHSAGGHLALLVAASANQSEYDNGDDLSVAACANLSGACDIYRAIEDGDAAAAHLFGKEISTIDEVKELVALGNPIHYINEKMPPTLLIHGEDDVLVPISQSEKMYELVPHGSFIRIKNADHFMLHDNQNMINISKQIALFFDNVFKQQKQSLMAEHIFKEYCKIKKKKQLTDEYFEMFRNIFSKYS